MNPVTYSIVRGTLRARIKLSKTPPGIYDTTIRVPKEQFDAKKQICGKPEIQLYMDKCRAWILGAIRPGSTPQSLWAAFMESETAKKIHTLADAFDYYFMESVVSQQRRETVSELKKKVERANLLYTDLRDLTPAIVSKFFRDLEEGGLKDTTAYMNLSCFKTLVARYDQAHRLKLDLDMSKVMKVPKQAKFVKPGEEPYLNLDQVVEILKLDLTGRPKLAYGRDLFCLMALTGMSVADLLAFTPALIDKSGWLSYPRTKNGEPCEVPLIAQAKEIIAKHTWPIRLAKRSVQHNCELLGKVVGRRISAHTGRKSWGCIALELGFSMEAVSKMLGHTSIRTTESIYAKVTRVKIEREIRELPAGMRTLMTQPLV